MWDPAGILSSCRQYARPGRVNRDAAGRSQVRTAQTGHRHGRRMHGHRTACQPGYSKTGASALRAGTYPRTSGHPSFHSIRSRIR